MLGDGRAGDAGARLVARRRRSASCGSGSAACRSPTGSSTCASRSPTRDTGRLLHTLDDALRFFVFPSGEETGAVLLDGEWSMQEIGAGAPTPRM